MNQLQRTLRILAVPAFIALAACSTDSVIPERTETVISSSGGTAISAAGELTLRVPAGVFPEGTRVIITTDRGTPSAPRVGPAFELDTEPRVSSFSASVDVALKNPQPGQAVGIANLDGATPVVVGGARYDAATATAHGQLAHFSRYGLISVTSSVSCPSAAPSPNSACVGDGLQCDFGQECCCGACYPSLDCTCSAGTWACANTDACLGAGMCGGPDGGVTDAALTDSGVAACPAEADVNNASCSTLGLSCDYGQEVCCGQSFPSMQCECDGNTFACRPTDACLVFPNCASFTETEPNENIAQANALPSERTVVVSARIGTNDLDVFQVIVPAIAGTAHGALNARTHTSPDDPESCNGLDTQLRFFDDQGNQLFHTYGTAGRPCAYFSATHTTTVTVGTYYIEVRTSSTSNMVFPQQDYYLTVDVDR